MRDIFPGYYHPTQEQFVELWQQCLFVLDTNILLNFYRYSPKTGVDLLGILQRVADRLWLPHQVALEYQENRLDEIAQQENIYSRVTTILGKTQEELAALLRRGHLSIDVDTLLNKLQSTFTEVENELNERRQQHPKLFNDDHLREALTDIFEAKVGMAFTQERLNKIYELGDKRYSAEMPPGYKDNSKKGVKRYGSLIIEEKYGDLILWYQMVEKAKEIKKPVIFVTDDAKEDWWWISHGRTIGPRPELVLEMLNEAGVLFYMYTSDRFIEYARDNLGVQVTQEVVDEIREVAESRNDWKDEVVSALVVFGGQASLSEIYNHVFNTTSRKLPVSWQDIIRNTLYIHSSESSAYRGGEDLFRRVGRGYWGLKTLQSSNDQLSISNTSNESASS
jgi:hypothetical protein